MSLNNILKKTLTRRYKLIFSISLGIMGLFYNLLNIKIFGLDNININIILGFIFPLLISLVWGWRYGLISAIIVGLPTILLLPYTDIYLNIFLVTVCVIWITYHGAMSHYRGRDIQLKWYRSMYVKEILFRSIFFIIFYVIVPTITSFNNIQQQSDITIKVFSKGYENYMIIENVVMSYLLLLLADILLKVKIIKNAFKINYKSKLDNQYIIMISLLFAALFWIIDSFSRSVFCKVDDYTLLDNLLFKIPINHLFTRSFVIIICFGTGLLLNSFFNRIEKQKEILKKSYIKVVKTKEKLIESEKKFKLYVEKAPYGIFVSDDKGNHVQVNEEACKISGYTKEELLKMRIVDVMSLESSKKIKENFKLINQSNISIAKLEYENKEGKIRKWFCKAIKLSETNILGFVEDITDSEMDKDSLKKSRERLHTTFLSVGEGIIVIDKKGKIELINNIAMQLTGYTKNEAMEVNFEEIFNAINISSKKSLTDLIKSVFETGKTLKLCDDIILLSKDKIETIIEGTIAPIKDEFNNINGIVIAFRDVTKERKKLEKIKYLSIHDQLTGFYNRSYFEEKLIEIDKDINLPISIVMSDVNGLKMINDAYGHKLGDELIKNVAKSIKHNCREEDFTARVSGDEFVIIFKKTDFKDAYSIINKIRLDIKNKEINGVSMSISFGLSTKRYKNESINDIYKEAEDNMNKNKLFDNINVKGNMIVTMINTLHEKNKREKQHSERVSELCKKMGQALSLNIEKINELKITGLLHDIGKTALPEYILNKPGKLTDEEWKQMKNHSEIGYRILSSVNNLAKTAEYALYHHERWDGNGYPKGLKDKEIPMMSRIITIADSYDAMIGERSYKKPLTKEEAIEEIKKNTGTQFDPDLAQIFITKVLVNNIDFNLNTSNLEKQINI